MRRSTVLSGTLLLLFTFAHPAVALLNEPFPAGGAMGHLATIMYENSSGSRGPGISSVYLPNRSAAGVHVAGVSYYDAMDNYEDRRIATVSGGGWISHQKWALALSVAHFDALGAYYEQEGYFSGAVAVAHGVKVSCSLRGIRMKIADPRYEPLTTASGDAAVLLPFSPVFVTVGVRSVLIHSRHTAGADPAIRYECGIHTVQHTYGAQGVRIAVVPNWEVPVIFSLGNEVWLHKRVALSMAIASNPLLFSMGLTVNVAPAGVNVAVVSHPALGWSQGFSMEYRLNER